MNNDLESVPAWQPANPQNSWQDFIINQRQRMLVPKAQKPARNMTGKPPRKVLNLSATTAAKAAAHTIRVTQRYGGELVGGQAVPSDASKPRRSSLPSLALVLECVEAQQRPHMSALCTIERDVAARVAAALDGAPSLPPSGTLVSCASLQATETTAASASAGSSAALEHRQC